jgi:hypothetical protein
MKRALRRAVVGLLSVLLLASVALLALAAWVSAPFEHTQQNLGRTALVIARAPAAERIVIGDSRVAMAPRVGGALFVGHAGATTSDLQRLAKVLCSVSDAPVVIALGVNDAIPALGVDVPATLARLAAMRRSCADRPVQLAEIWPVEPSRPPLGGNFDLAVIGQINRGIRRLADQTGAGLIPAPALLEHTVDGVHFTPALSERYARTLAAVKPAR